MPDVKIWIFSFCRCEEIQKRITTFVKLTQIQFAYGVKTD